MKELFRALKFGAIAIFLLIAVSGIFRLIERFQKNEAPLGSSQEYNSSDFRHVGWQLLRQLNYKTGEAPESLRSIDEKRVRIPGFIVPLEDDQSEVTEFLLVPSAQACIHVPPPPPNQMVYVSMRKPVSIRAGSRAYWVLGIFSLEKVESPYGAVSFQMLGDAIEPFQFSPP